MDAGYVRELRGFTQQELIAFTPRRVITMVGSAVYLALRNRIDLHRIVDAKPRHASEERESFARVSALFPTKP